MTIFCTCIILGCAYVNRKACDWWRENRRVLAQVKSEIDEINRNAY